MKRSVSAGILAGLLVSAPAAEWTGPGDKTLTLIDEEAADCAVQGECAVFSRRQIDAMLTAQREMTRDEMRKLCVFAGIGRES
jgi:hypothetical protein